MGNIKFSEKQYEAAKNRVKLFFSKNADLVQNLSIPKSHLTRLIIAKSFGFYGNYQQPAFFEVLEELKKTKKLSENPFKSLKVTAQKLTNQKPTKKYKKCI